MVISEKSSLKNVNYSPNHFIFSRKTIFPNVNDNGLSALENTTYSELVTNNSNDMNSARKNFIENKSSNKPEKAKKHNIRNYSDVVYQAYNKACSERKDGESPKMSKESNRCWWTVILVKEANS